MQIVLSKEQVRFSRFPFMRTVAQLIAEDLLHMYK